MRSMVDGGMQPEMVKQLKALEKENARLKKLVADQALDMEILKSVSCGRRPSRPRVMSLRRTGVRHLMHEANWRSALG